MRVSSLSALRLSLEECLQKPGECTKSLQTGVSNAKYEQAVVIASFVLLLFYSFYSSITENKWLLQNFLTSEKLNRSNSRRRRNTVRITQDKILLTCILSCMIPWTHYFKFTHNIAGNTLPTC